MLDGAMADEAPEADTPDLEWDTAQLPGWRETVNSWSWRPTGTREWEKSGHALAVTTR